jgi:hypothetical protein
MQVGPYKATAYRARRLLVIWDRDVISAGGSLNVVQQKCSGQPSSHVSLQTYREEQAVYREIHMSPQSRVFLSYLSGFPGETGEPFSPMSGGLPLAKELNSIILT